MNSTAYHCQCKAISNTRLTEYLNIDLGSLDSQIWHEATDCTFCNLEAKYKKANYMKKLIGNYGMKVKENKALLKLLLTLQP